MPVPNEIVFKAMIAAHNTSQISVGTASRFRGDELIVKTPDNFNICGLFVGADAVIPVGEKYPAAMFAEDVSPELRQLLNFVADPWPAMSIVLVVENDSDDEREFEAVVKGQSL